MQLKVISTGSVGNCYVLENEHEALLIEVGVQLKKIKQALNFNLSKVKGALCSHSHGDHAKSINEVMQSGINVWSSEATHAACGTTMHHRACMMKENEIYQIGGFKIKPFEVKHDVPCFGFLINHEECGTTLFMTDTYYSPYTFRNLHNIIIEANYSHEVIRVKLNEMEFLKNRVMQSHMSLDTCIEFLKKNDLSKVNNIVLIHLSDGNSDEVLFREEVTKATGKTVTVADNGLSMNLNKTPF
jgi:phosphoribosyl 1,2-cyclic phosphodiesterase